MDQVPLIVLGADLDGLVAALALAHQGFPVHLLERGAPTDSFPDTAVLTPAAVQELVVLGLADPVTARAAEPQEITQADGCSGATLRHVVLGSAVRERYGHPYLTSRRADLRALLVGACDADEMIHVEYGCRIESLEDIGEAVLLGLDGGRHIRAEAVVAADGASSRVRALLGGGHPASLPFVVHSGPGPRIVGGDPVRTWSSSTVWVVQVPVGGNASEVAVIVRGDLYDDLRSGADHGVPPGLLDQHHPEVRAVARYAFAGQGSRVFRHHAPLERWSQHRMTVLGAAAAPMLPHAALATASALVDAGALGAAFDRADGRIHHALEGYVRSRSRAWTRLGQRTHEFAMLCHADGLLRRMRDRLWAGQPIDTLAATVELPGSG